MGGISFFKETTFYPKAFFFLHVFLFRLAEDAGVSTFHIFSVLKVWYEDFKS